MIHVLLLATLAQTPQTWEAAGNNPPYAFSIQGITNGTPVPISGSISTSGAADTVGSTATFNANSVCASVLTAGQTGAGFFLAAGTLVATLTPYVSTDSTNGVNGNWTATQFVDISGNKTSTQAFTNPNAFAAFGLVLEAGVRAAKVCTTAYTSGSATGNLVASTPQPPPPAAGADVTDRAGRLLGELTDGTSAIVPAKTGQLPTALDGSGFLKTHEQGTAAISAASLPLPTGASTAAKQPALGTAGTASTDVLTVQGIASMTALKVDGSAVTQPVSGTFWQATQPVSAASLPLPTGAATEATLAKIPVAQASTTSGQSGALIQGAVTTAAPTYTTAQTNPLSLTTAGALRVDGSAVTQPVSGTFWQATQPVSGTVTANAGSGTFTVSGTTTANQGTAAALSGAWPIKLTDGTNTAPTMDAAGRAGFQKLTDGTNSATVKAASTAAATTDTAVVTQESPEIAEACPNFLSINQTASTDVLTSVAKLHICSIVLINDAAGASNKISIVEGTGTLCATGQSLILGGASASAGVAAGGGFAMTAARPFLKTKTTADHLCILQSGATNVSGMITYADQ